LGLRLAKVCEVRNWCFDEIEKSEEDRLWNNEIGNSLVLNYWRNKIKFNPNFGLLNGPLKIESSFLAKEIEAERERRIMFGTYGIMNRARKVQMQTEQIE